MSPGSHASAGHRIPKTSAGSSLSAPGSRVLSIQKTSSPCTAVYRVSSYPGYFTDTCTCPNLACHVYYVRDMTTGDIGALILNIIESSMEDTRIPESAAQLDAEIAVALARGP